MTTTEPHHATERVGARAARLRAAHGRPAADRPVPQARSGGGASSRSSCRAPSCARSTSRRSSGCCGWCSTRCCWRGRLLHPHRHRARRPPPAGLLRAPGRRHLRLLPDLAVDPRRRRSRSSRGGKLILNCAFPRMLLPLSSVVLAFKRFVPTVIVYLPIHIASGLPFGVHALWVIPLLALMLCLALGLSMLAAAVQVYFRDLASFLPYAAAGHALRRAGPVLRVARAGPLRAAGRHQPARPAAERVGQRPPLRRTGRALHNMLIATAWARRLAGHRRRCSSCRGSVSSLSASENGKRVSIDVRGPVGHLPHLGREPADAQVDGLAPRARQARVGGDRGRQGRLLHRAARDRARRRSAPTAPASRR